MAGFTHPDSIVRTIWGRGDTVLLIFAGSAAEFALNRSVDWLYFTGRLPADPLGRLFSTVAYAQRIVFAEEDRALAAIDSITAIHKGVEAQRGASIPATAYLDVLFMLIGYSISSFELLERKLRPEEKAEVFAVFARVGRRMGLAGMPGDYEQWERMRHQYLQENLVRSSFTQDLYKRYRKSLGPVRYFLLIQAQVLLTPGRVRRLLDLPSLHLFYPVVQVYKLFHFLHLDKGIKTILLPPRYREAVFGLDQKMG
ncbi:oxygenase MpaB family protein [Puia dinghuensis]|uniref:ER-bound oxygenase mpaB/mpaB'/Rubber oxygenase catalytic domain-containing protein n=1 Tax=Puia dinghuensis TaxID=1792502 RepID=A0A8J2XQB8_9BACT|nr:oxygenase MpaB family protein [Puia dinghuensis]GGA84203.1 hypothetical protein GCM10011511_04190 [Puia dinghuensis]